MPEWAYTGLPPEIRTLRWLGPCECCKQHVVELVLCECTHYITSHRLDLKQSKCDVSGCKCRQATEAPGQEDLIVTPVRYREAAK